MHGGCLFAARRQEVNSSLRFTLIDVANPLAVLAPHLTVLTFMGLRQPSPKPPQPADPVRYARHRQRRMRVPRPYTKCARARLAARALGRWRQV
jgi:hypothetical protein